jgi:hypothetical protein
LTTTTKEQQQQQHWRKMNWTIRNKKPFFLSEMEILLFAEFFLLYDFETFVNLFRQERKIGENRRMNFCTKIEKNRKKDNKL